MAQLAGNGGGFLQAVRRRRPRIAIAYFGGAPAQESLTGERPQPGVRFAPATFGDSICPDQARLAAARLPGLADEPFTRVVLIRHGADRGVQPLLEVSVMLPGKFE